MDVLEVKVGRVPAASSLVVVVRAVTGDEAKTDVSEIVMVEWVLISCETLACGVVENVTVPEMRTELITV